MDIKLSEHFIIENGVDLYPITLIKFLLNRKKILTYFHNVTKDNFVIRFKQTLNPNSCKHCQELPEGSVCRNHNSLQRILSGNNILFDEDSSVYLYKNEIFKVMGDKLIIVYCPHPKMITGRINDDKVRKISPVTFVGEKDIKIPDYKNIVKFSSLKLMKENLLCWFNRDFSIVTIPNNIDVTDWCLIPNK